MTFFNTLYFLNDEISSFSFFRFESAPQLPILLTVKTIEENSNKLGKILSRV